MRTYSPSAVAALVASLRSVLPLERSHTVTCNLLSNTAKHSGAVITQIIEIQLGDVEKKIPSEPTHFPPLCSHLLKWYLSSDALPCEG